MYIVSDNLIEFNQYSSDMFNKFTKVDIIQFRNVYTKMVTSMRVMFVNCSRLISIDVSNFSTKSTYLMFGNNAKTENLDQLCELDSIEEWCKVN